MSSTRKLRKHQLLLEDSFDDEEDDYKENETSVTTPQKAERKVVSDNEVSTRGLSPSLKKKLLAKLDEYGGAAAVSYDNRLLSVICDLDQDNFGSPNGKTPRKRRKQCQNFVYQFSKMDPSKQAARRAQILSYKSDSHAVVRPFTIVSPDLLKSFAERSTKSIKAKPNTHVQREPTKKEVAEK